MTDPRKAERPDPLATARTLSTDKRDKVAEEAFNLDAVLFAVAEAAAAGFANVTMEPPELLDLRGTPTWKDTTDRLGKLGFTTEARGRDGKEEGRTSYALFVSWAT
jgi:hypothetical protein